MNEDETEADADAKLSWQEIGILSEGFALASRPFKQATHAVTEEYALGPRGAWILVVLSTGQVHPLDLTRVFEVGRSLITAELTRLTEAGLVSYRKSADDGRRVELTLSPLGRQVCARIKGDWTRLVLDRLKGYTREEILLCARLLRDFRGAEHCDDRGPRVMYRPPREIEGPSAATSMRGPNPLSSAKPRRPRR